MDDTKLPKNAGFDKNECSTVRASAASSLPHRPRYTPHLGLQVTVFPNHRRCKSLQILGLPHTFVQLSICAGVQVNISRQGSVGRECLRISEIFT